MLVVSGVSDMNRFHAASAALCLAALVAATSAHAASIRREIVVDQDPAVVWDAVRDFNAVHKRLVPGFVTDTKVEPDARVVTFANGSVARELLVDIDDKSRRLVYAVVGGRVRTHSASVQVFAEGNGARLVWIADVLPNELAAYIAGQMDEAAKVMKQTLQRNPARN
jgi:carbon monoxide dehydrogenase subunit G